MRKPFGGNASRRLRPGVPRSLLGVLFLAVLVLGPAQPASAHAGLVGSDPAEGAVLGATPAQVELVFSAPVRADGTKVVIDVGTRSVVVGAPTVTDATVTVHLAADAGTGSFTVHWQALAFDTHTTTGQFGFSIDPAGGTAASPAPQPVVPTTSGSAFGRGQAGFWLSVAEVAGITLLAGVLSWQLWCSAGRRRPAQLVCGAGLVVVVSWLATTSHAADTPGRLVTTILLTVHVLCMTVWAAAVGMFAARAVSRRTGLSGALDETLDDSGSGRLDAATGRFSQWAVVAVPVGLLAGVFVAVNEVGSVRYVLIPSTFTVVLAIKAALALVALGLAWRFRSGPPQARPSRPGLVLGLESGVLVTALLASAVLAQTDPLSSWTSSTTAVKVGARVAVASCPIRTPHRLTCRVQLFAPSGAHDISVRVVSVQLSSGPRSTRRLDLEPSGGAVRFTLTDGLGAGPWTAHLDYRVTDDDTGSATFPVQLS